jgi:hypothetical protein
VTKKSRRRTASVVAAFAFLAASFTVTASPAAASGSVTCAGTVSTTYTPGLTLTPQTVGVHEEDSYTGCTSSVPGITSGTSLWEVDLNMSCLSPGQLDTTEYVVEWNDSSTSVTELTFSYSTVAGQSVATGVGTVASGRYAGGTVVGVWTYLQLNLLQCLASPGVTEQNGVIALSIIG